MNYLAHACLSFGKPAYLVGNFLGDFVKNRDLAYLTPEIVAGVRLHRSIDTFTDQHPLILEANKLLYPLHRKYAGVLMDIFCDHLLAKAWNDFCQKPMRSYINEAYTAYQDYEFLMQNPVRQRMQAMVADDWLWHYGDIQGIEKTLYYLARRVSRPTWLEGAVDTLQREEQSINDMFASFFPDLILHAQETILQNEVKS